jgi:hypothetical protein
MHCNIAVSYDMKDGYKDRNKLNNKIMKTAISISDFQFSPAGYGHYKVTYTSPVTGKSWKRMTSDMSLIDATKNADEPLKKDLE